MLSLVRRARYLSWAASRRIGANLDCPWCGCPSSKVSTKAFVTQLRECGGCRLRFRVPKDDLEIAEEFYENEYEQGFTTDCPTDEELERLVATGFAGSPKDYRAYLGVLRAAGLQDGARVLDFGSSWGYGSWQMSRAGYRVSSYELSRSRGRFAKDRLGCDVISDPAAAGTFDCIFAAHVLEHLARPQLFWDIARQVTAPGGWAICFVPNGNPELEQVYGKRRYHRLWGKVHPLLLNEPSLKEMASRNGFSATLFSSPYIDHDIASRVTDSALMGDELAIIARRRSSAEKAQ